MLELLGGGDWDADRVRFSALRLVLSNSVSRLWRSDSRVPIASNNLSKSDYAVIVE